LFSPPALIMSKAFEVAGEIFLLVHLVSKHSAATHGDGV
jgi:hypothetical protein